MLHRMRCLASKRTPRRPPLDLGVLVGIDELVIDRCAKSFVEREVYIGYSVGISERRRPRMALCCTPRKRRVGNLAETGSGGCRSALVCQKSDSRSFSDVW